jgi:hypothetical protein
MHAHALELLDLQPGFLSPAETYCSVVLSVPVRGSLRCARVINVPVCMVLDQRFCGLLTCILETTSGHSFLDVGSGCGILTCMGAKLVHPGGLSVGIDIRKRAIDFAQHNTSASCALIRRNTDNAAARALGAAFFQGSMVQRSSSHTEEGSDHVGEAEGGGKGERGVNVGGAAEAAEAAPDSNGVGVDPEAERVVLKIGADLGDGGFEALMMHVKSSYLVSHGAVYSLCVGVVKEHGVVVREVEVIKVTASAAHSVVRATPVEYLLQVLPACAQLLSLHAFAQKRSASALVSCHSRGLCCYRRLGLREGCVEAIRVATVIAARLSCCLSTCGLLFLHWRVVSCSSVAMSSMLSRPRASAQRPTRRWAEGVRT